VSVQQVRFFYQKTSGEREYVTECRDSEDTAQRYEHSISRGICEDQVNQEKGSVLVMGAPAYRRAGSVRQAADCRPLEDQSVNMQTEVCEDRYTHDRSTGTSFLRTRSFYKPGGEKKIVTPCGRDPNRSYDHTENASACDDEFDDTSKLRRVKAQTVFEGYQGETVQIDGCDVQESVAYTQITDKVKTSTYNKAEAGEDYGCGRWVFKSNETKLRALLKNRNWSSNTYEAKYNGSDAEGMLGDEVALVGECPGSKMVHDCGSPQVKVHTKVEKWARGDGTVHQSTYRETHNLTPAAPYCKERRRP